MAQDLSPTGRLRVGHRERDAVAAILQEAAADGRLSLDELDQRLDHALQAKTYAELDPLVADLGVDLPSNGLGLSQPPVQGPPPAGYSRDDPLRLGGGMSSDKRQGVWRVPPYVMIIQGVGGVVVNCLEAEPAAPVIEVEVIGGTGSIVVILPDGWAADDDRLAKTWGSKSIAVPREPAPGQPKLVLRGSLGMGSFKVRPANSYERRRLAKEAIRRQRG